MRRCIIFLFSFILGNTNVFSQQGQISNPLDAIANPSPTAMALNKYTEIPVSLNTGTPNISIPIYEIKTKSLNLPIILSYHASGIRVNENASNIGLGWALQAEGVITRSVLGREDNGSYQTIGGLNWYQSGVNIGDPAQYQALRSIAEYGADGSPDLYMYNFNGNNGRFIYTDKAKFLPHTNIQIIKSGINGWKAVTEDGDQYFFEAQERSKSRTSTTAEGSTVGWYLTKIVAVNNTDSILFSYVDTHYNTEIGYSHVIDYYSRYSIMTAEANTQTIYNNSLFSKQLTKIEFNEGSIEYNIDLSSRLDVLNAPIVKGVLIKNKQGKVLRSVEFKHDYFISVYNDDKRLKLTGVLIYPEGNTTDTTKAERYQFTYNETPLPARNSKAQDHWGYYNGADNNQTLIPSWKSCIDYINPPNCNFCDPSPTAIFQGANRNTDSNHVKAGMLERITYPTGGHVKFAYEPHLVPSSGEGEANTFKDSLVASAEMEYLPLSSSFVTDTSYKYTVPNLPEFQNGVCASFFAGIGTDADMEHFTHASPSAALYEEGKATSIATIAFSYSEDGSLYAKSTAVTLYPGKTYYVIVRVREIDCFLEAQLQVKVLEKKPPSNLVGGCRIKEIQFYTEDNQLAKRTRYEYVMPDNSGLSSGRIRISPEYVTSISKFQNDFPDANCSEVEIMGVRLSSNSIWSLGTGSHISYSFVKVKEIGPDDNGSSLYQYSNFDSSDVDWFDASWRRGQLLSQTDYNSAGKKIREIRNDYNTDYRGFEGFEGRQLSFYSAHPCAGPSSYNYSFPVRFSLNTYRFPSEWTYLKSTEEEIFSTTIENSSVITKKIFEYSSPEHKKVTQVTTFLSDGKESNTYFKYPHDYIGSVVYDSMVQRNMIAPVIEQVTQNGTTELSKTRINYAFWNNKKIIAPDSLKKSILGNVLEAEAIYSQYDQNGNLLDYTTKNGITTAIQWGYNKSNPIVQVLNASATDIFYTSFEEGDGNSTDGDAKTGRKSKTGGYSIQLTGLSNGSYVLSYWQKSGSNWVLQTSSVAVSTNAYTINLTGQVDEVRFYPARAQMTTYTYEPLIGMSSSTDVNNRTTYYEYDSFGRLMHVRDEKKNILKKYCYNYQGQAISCN